MMSSIKKVELNLWLVIQPSIIFSAVQLEEENLAKITNAIK
jgi:hypothetical protein